MHAHVLMRNPLPVGQAAYVWSKKITESSEDVCLCRNCSKAQLYVSR